MTQATKRHENIVARENVAIEFAVSYYLAAGFLKSHTS